MATTETLTPDEWHGPVFKRYIDEDDFKETTLDSYPEIDSPSRTGPITRSEAEKLVENGDATRFVKDEKGDRHLRRTILRDDAVLDTHQVFIEQTSDGREKDRIHYVRGATNEDGEDNLDTKEDSVITHIGSIREYLNQADELSYDIRSGTTVPGDLWGYNYQLSQAYQQVTS